jgi:mono/diheme cytochrome c family protein
MIGLRRPVPESWHGAMRAAAMLGAVLLLTLLVALPRGIVHAAPALVDPHRVMTDPDQARSDYIEHCSGCHGQRGDTVPARLPELEGRVGWFMCTPEARAYLLRLPNVAHSRITDNAELADMMNYVVFVLGEGTAPAGTPPFTGDEVARERVHALTNINLTAERLRLANQIVRQCHAPASIRQLYIGDIAGPKR